MLTHIRKEDDSSFQKELKGKTIYLDKIFMFYFGKVSKIKIVQNSFFFFAL